MSRVTVEVRSSGATSHLCLQFLFFTVCRSCIIFPKIVAHNFSFSFPRPVWVLSAEIMCCLCIFQLHGLSVSAWSSLNTKLSKGDSVPCSNLLCKSLASQKKGFGCNLKHVRSPVHAVHALRLSMGRDDVDEAPLAHLGCCRCCRCPREICCAHRTLQCDKVEQKAKTV